MSRRYLSRLHGPAAFAYEMSEGRSEMARREGGIMWESRRGSNLLVAKNFCVINLWGCSTLLRADPAFFCLDEEKDKINNCRQQSLENIDKCVPYH